MQVTGNSRHPEMQLPLLHEDVLQVVTPHGPGFYQHVVHLHSCRKGFVGLFGPVRKQNQNPSRESEHFKPEVVQTCNPSIQDAEARES
jgi:hypothetical protein